MYSKALTGDINIGYIMGDFVYDLNTTSGISYRSQVTPVHSTLKSTFSEIFENLKKSKCSKKCNAVIIDN